MMLMTRLGAIASQSGVSSRTITIDSSKIDADLTNYPVMVKLTPNNFNFPKVRADGMDIAFYDTSNNLLDFEREYFLTNSQGVFHVRIPSVSSSTNTTFKMVYGSGLATDLSNKTGVWDNNFVMVQHMGDSLVDSTGNGNDGTNVGTTVVDGLNGKSRSFNGSTTAISVPNCTVDGQPHTVQVFSQNNKTLYASSDTGNNRTTLYVSPGPVWNPGLWITNVFVRSHAKGMYVDTTVNAIGTKPHILGQVYKGTTDIKNIVNEGVLGGTTTSYDVMYGTSIVFGNETASGSASPYAWNGLIDEVRISNIARSDAWIKADDHNLRLNDLVVIGG